MKHEISAEGPTVPREVLAHLYNDWWLNVHTRHLVIHLWLKGPGWHRMSQDEVGSALGRHKREILEISIGNAIRRGYIRWAEGEDWNVHYLRYVWPIEPCNKAPATPYRRNIGLAQRRRILKRDGHKCVWCGETKNLHVDHITPYSAGGSNEDDNLRVLCRACNLSRVDRKGPQEDTLLKHRTEMALAMEVE